MGRPDFQWTRKRNSLKVNQTRHLSRLRFRESTESRMRLRCDLTDLHEFGEHGFRLKSRFARTVKIEHDLTADNHHKVISTRLLQLLERRIINSPVGLEEAAEDSPRLQLA